MNISKILIKVLKATMILIKLLKATMMCMYIAHWNIFMVNKCDLQKNKKNTLISFYKYKM